MPPGISEISSALSANDQNFHNPQIFLPSIFFQCINNKSFTISLSTIAKYLLISDSKGKVFLQKEYMAVNKFILLGRDFSLDSTQQEK